MVLRGGKYGLAAMMDNQLLLDLNGVIQIYGRRMKCALSLSSLFIQIMNHFS